MNIYKTIDGTKPLAQVSVDGKVRVQTGFLKWQYCKYTYLKNGLLTVKIKQYNKIKVKLIHQLVYDYFSKKEFYTSPIQIKHLDNNKFNNSVENLKVIL